MAKEPEAVIEAVADDAAREAGTATANAVVAEVNKKDAEASTTKTAAEAAVALANGAAAATILDATERERAFFGKVETWQTEQRTEIQQISERMKGLEGGLSAIVSALSSPKPPVSSPPKSENTEVMIVKPGEVEREHVEGEDRPVPKTKPEKRRRRFV